MNSKISVSLCMIARNGAKTLARAVNSVKEMVSEIVLVDTGSTDDTISLAQKLQAKVFHFAWNDDFSAARNASIA